MAERTRGTEALNDALSGRLDGWRVAVLLLREHPLTGVGLGAYRAEFSGAKLRLVSLGVPFYPGHINANFANAHDEYLEVGGDLGWPGLAALAWGIATLVGAAWRARDRLTAADRGLALGGVVSLALLALAYFPMRLGPVAYCWIGWMAWLFAAASAREGDAVRLSQRVRAFIACLLALALAGQVVRSWHRLQASTLVREVRLQVGATGSTIPAALVRAGEMVLREAHRRDPAAIEPFAYRADLYLLTGRLADADAAYRRAAAHELRPETLYNWGLALDRQGRTAEAVVELRRAVALQPRLLQQLAPELRARVAVAPLIPVPPMTPMPPVPGAATRPAS
jgi:tetratricopeptide (TPR) repeat protein